MTYVISELEGERLLECEPDGPVLAQERDASDLIGDASGEAAATVVIPTTRLSEDFFRLSSGLAGAVVQKFVNYGLRLVVLGDVSSRTAQSKPLHDWVYESNRGRHLWFVRDRQELGERLAMLRSAVEKSGGDR